jgi:hypothetical protein
MRTLFAEVFAPNTMSAEHWRWKYGGGRGRGMEAWHQGELVAFYGGLPRRISFKGEPRLAMQIVDVMVRASERGVLRREGAFFQTAATFLECFVGYGSDAILGYGFPTVRALKAARRMGLYGTVGEVHELSWESAPTSEHGTYKLDSVPRLRVARWSRAIGRLWDAMQVSLPGAIVGVRDWAFIRSRFIEHPDKVYHYALLRRGWTRRAQALMVLAFQDETCHLRDYVGDMRHLPIAIERLRGYAASRGLKQVKTWITKDFAHVFPEDGRAERALDISVPHSTCTFGPELSEVKGQWWLMAGDTDFL